MVIHNENGLVRVTVTLEPIDVQLLDALARFEGQNRSAELRGLLVQVRPIMQQLVSTFTAAEKQRGQLNLAMANASVSDLESITAEAEEVGKKMLAMFAALEGAATANAPASNTGAPLDN